MDPNPNWLGPQIVSFVFLALSYAAAFSGLGLVGLFLVFVAFVFHDTARDRRQFQRSIRIERRKS